MTRWSQDSEWKRATLAVVILLALSLRFFMPAGVMPAPTSQGLTISLCSDMISDSARVHEIGHGEDDDAPAGESQSQPCAFTALASPALAGEAGALPPPVAESAPDRTLPPQQARNPMRCGFLSPPARGPPTLA